jgi:hypothetical protein
MNHASVLYKACKEEYYYYVFFFKGRGGPEQSRFSRFLLLFFCTKLEVGNDLVKENELA